MADFLAFSIVDFPVLFGCVSKLYGKESNHVDSTPRHATYTRSVHMDTTLEEITIYTPETQRLTVMEKMYIYIYIYIEESAIQARRSESYQETRTINATNHPPSSR